MLKFWVMSRIPYKQIPNWFKCQLKTTISKIRWNVILSIQFIIFQIKVRIKEEVRLKVHIKEEAQLKVQTKARVLKKLSITLDRSIHLCSVIKGVKKIPPLMKRSRTNPYRLNHRKEISHKAQTDRGVNWENSMKLNRIWI